MQTNLYKFEQSDAIRRLQDELAMTRHAIIGLMPSEISTILRSYYSCENRLESIDWIDFVSKDLIENHAKRLPDEVSFFQDRAYCPLCGGGNDCGYNKGFTVPEGLRRHLTGWGKAKECSVLHAARMLAEGYWDHMFLAQEKEEEEKKEKLLAARRLNEIIYCISLKDEPKLIDEVMRGEAREHAKMGFAERRLADLGFQANQEKNIKSFTREYEDVIVYADPREANKIVFRVCRRPNKKGGRRRIRLEELFCLADNCDDIVGKYDSSLAEALENLAGLK